MHHRHLVSRLSVAVLLCVGAATPGSALTVLPDGDPVLYWNQILSTALPGSPTSTSRGYAMVEVAVHDAVNATMGSPHKSYLGLVPNNGGDTRAAVSVAAHTVLIALNPAKAADFDAALAASLALVPDGLAKTAGIATGNAIGMAAISRRSADGSSAVVPYTPSGVPGRWAPTPPANLPAALPQWGLVDPWLLNSADQFRPAAPPTIDSVTYATAFNQVKDIGSATSLSRTSDQTASALFWEKAVGTSPWILAGIAGSLADNLSTLENASLFAQLGVATADAAIAIWDAKYTYDYWRPVTAIRAADLDGNALTDMDPSWLPLITTPPHPSYVSGHSAIAGAASVVLSDVLGDDFDFCLSALGVPDRCWTSFSSSAVDAMNSRLWGGIHWQFDNLAGLDLGKNVAMFDISQAEFNPVPEPASWLMMVSGFALLGAALRRRSTVISFV